MTRLENFLQFLESELLPNIDITGNFVHRFCIQKYVYIATHSSFGLDMRYDFDLYVHGPYSPELTAAYYDLAEKNWRNGADPRSLGRFNKSAYLKLVNGKSRHWLEGASTMMFLAQKRKPPKNLLVAIYKEKSFLIRQFVRQIKKDLVQARVFSEYW